MITICRRSLGFHSLIASTVLAGAALFGSYSAAQNNQTAHAANGASKATSPKEFKFEVISIHPAKPGLSPYDKTPAPFMNFNPSPTGYSSTMTVWQMLMIAYAPGSFESWASMPMLNEPKWVGEQEMYVINAHVADKDIEAWRNQSGKHELLRLAMQALLKDRCKLVVHQTPAEIPDYNLTIGKKGLKIKPTAPGSVLPKGELLPSGGVRTYDVSGRKILRFHYYGATMEDLAAYLSGFDQHRPVHDKTGLTGRYDFTLQRTDDTSLDPDEQVYMFRVDPLGLQLKPGKGTVLALHIDHIEKPSPN